MNEDLFSLLYFLSPCQMLENTPPCCPLCCPCFSTPCPMPGTLFYVLYVAPVVAPPARCPETLSHVALYVAPVLAPPARCLETPGLVGHPSGWSCNAAFPKYTFDHGVCR
jgi:hypothetical protein